MVRKGVLELKSKGSSVGQMDQHELGLEAGVSPLGKRW